MRKSKKQLLGIGGLAIVAAITTVAANLPVRAQSAGGEVEVQVTVYNTSGEIKFITPEDNQVVVGSTLSISDLFSKAEKIDYTIAKDGGTPGSLLTYIPENEDGRHQFETDLRNFGGYGRYTIKALLTTTVGTTTEDYVSIIYTAANVGETTTDEETGNPIVPVDYDEATETICFGVKDKAGKEVLMYCVDVEPGPGHIDVELPFDENGLGDDEYTIEVIPYKKGDDGELERLDDEYTPTATIVYKAPESPDVPNTGEDIEVPNTGFAALNLSKTDAVITSLIGFAIVSGLALRAMRKARK